MIACVLPQQAALNLNLLTFQSVSFNPQHLQQGNVVFRFPVQITARITAARSPLSGRETPEELRWPISARIAIRLALSIVSLHDVRITDRGSRSFQ